MKFIYCILIWIQIQPFQSKFEMQKQSGWTKVKEDDGITIFEMDTNAVNIKKFMAIGEANTTLTAITNLFLDVDSYPDWIEGVDKAQIISMESDSVFIYHSYIKIPILTNRDVVAKVSIHQNENSKVVSTLSLGLPDLYPDEKYIRIKTFKTSWKFIPLGENKIKIIYKGLADIGSPIFQIITKKIVINNLYYTIDNMRNKSTEAQYRTKKLNLIRELY